MVPRGGFRSVDRNRGASQSPSRPAALPFSFFNHVFCMEYFHVRIKNGAVAV